MDTIAFSLRVTAPAPDVARVSIGRRQFSIGRPLEFDERVAACRGDRVRARRGRG